ncbi:MAG: hypothetical protein ACM3S5_09035 [Rhodospirillales bacterium]
MKTKIALLLVTLSAAALGQGLTGYGFFAPGRVTPGSTGTMNFGVGADGVIGKGIGAGAELGVLSPWDCFSECVVGMFSPNVTYHFLRENQRRVDPYVTAGYTLMFREGHANLFNFGGGMNYWFARRIGFRAEFRDHVHFDSNARDHFWGFRFGLAFR